MNPAMDPLAELAPLRTPEPLGWWPPAPGWWLLAGLVLALLGWLLLKAWSRHRARRPRRIALARLEELYARVKDDSEFQRACNHLLKGLALNSFERARVAALSGEAWRNFLNASMPGKRAPFNEHLLADVYANQPQPVDRSALYSACRSWIRHHREQT